MSLLADRFVLRDRESAFDLATARRVEIVYGTAGGAADQAAWASRCAAFANVHYRAFAPLLDYGVIGEQRRFEAWASDGRWLRQGNGEGQSDGAQRVRDVAQMVLRATHRTVGDLSITRLRCVDGRPVVLPDAATGFETEPGAAHDTSAQLCVEDLGIEVLEHGAVHAVAGLLRDATGPPVRVLAIWGPHGSGLARAARHVARHARLAGCVPIDASVPIDADVPAILKRSVCLIVRGDPVGGWQCLLDRTLLGARPRFVLFVSHRSVEGVRAIPLDQFSPEVLLASVKPSSSADVHRRQIVVAIRRSRGWVGAFSRALRSSTVSQVERATAAVVRAAEQSPEYRTDAQDSSKEESFGGSAMRPVSWPAAADAANHVRQLNRGLEAVAAGHRARGERAVREAIGCLIRREAWESAWRGTVDLARALRDRGRTTEAQRLVETVRPSDGRNVTNATKLSALILSGTLATDMRSFDEAETLLSAAVRSARGLGERALIADAALALSRCLFWRGRYDIAAETLSSIDPDASRSVSIRVAIGRARVAIGRHDVPSAVAQATEAHDLACGQSDVRLQALAAHARGFVYHVIGDDRAAAEALARAVSTGRRARLPLLVVRARLLIAEGQRRRGRRGPALRLVRRLARSTIPPLLRAHVDLVAALLTERPGADLGTRPVAIASVPALQLFEPAPERSADRAVVSDTVDILHLCQAAVEPERVLTDSCRFVRDRLEASAVGVFGSGSEEPRLLAADGGRLDTEIAARVGRAASPVPPHFARLCVEGGVPVRYGGRVIGVLVARWTAAHSPDPERVVALLETVAAAIGPALAEQRSTLATPQREGNPELLGVSRAARDLRLAIERAAASPFPVLVEGESGSGKELVARALHRSSPRREGAYVVINCASLPDDLVESELFGHARGAFTGALAERVGVFEAAHRGTLFLDEIGELSQRAQAKVLRTIQDGEIRRVGDNAVRRVDVRIVAATNRRLRVEAEAGRFRADLLYRLDVVRISVLPLRERRDDVIVLAEHFWNEAARRVGSRATLSGAALAALARYDWPGNVRELQNVLAALVVRSPRRGVVPAAALPTPFHAAEASGSLRLDAARRQFDLQFVRAALARAGGCRVHAARELGVTRQGLTKLIARLGVECA